MLFCLRRLILIFSVFLISPILLLLACTVLFFNLVHLLTRFTRRPLPASGMPLSGLASIIILNWNGKDLLAQGLPSVLEAVRVDGRTHEVLVVDNGSTDGSVEYVQREFPDVRVLALPENLGFAGGNNVGVRAARHDTVVLLNNDMVVEPGFLRPLLDGFRPGTFAVSSQIYLQEDAARREETGKTAAVFRRGMIDYSHRPLEGQEWARPHYPTFWAGGGSSAFHRERFLSLGGLQEIYSPAYVEDADLSYQAWKVGWEVLFAPASVVYHKHRASTGRRFKPAELQRLIQRNQFMFIWKNIRSWSLLLSHCLFLPWTCYRLARDYGLGIWLSLAQATLRLPAVQISKMSVPFRGVRSDQDIFRLSAKPGLYFCREAGRTRTNGRKEHDTRPRVLWLTAYLPHLGRHAGAGRMFQLLRRISRSYRITLLSFIEAEEEREFLPEVRTWCEHLEVLRRTPPLRWQLFAYEPFDEFRTPQMEAALQAYIEHYDYDLIQLEYTQMGLYADREFGIPILLTKHEVDFAACLRRSRLERNFWRKTLWFYNYLQVLDREIKLLKGIDAVVCMTDPDAQALRRFCSSVPLHVVNTGVDLDYFMPPVKRAAEPRMVFVGAFQHLPNVEAMIYFCRAILPLIRKQVPEAALTIVGSKPTPEILGLAEEPGVEVTGYVADIRPHMASASVYVVPLRLGVGIRGKILEAWGMAMAVVATPVACAGLHCEHGKNLLVADGAELFAEHVAALLKDPERRLRLGLEGRQTAERYYGWEASAKKLDALYQQLILKARPREAEGNRPLANMVSDL